MKGGMRVKEGLLDEYEVVKDDIKSYYTKKWRCPRKSPFSVHWTLVLWAWPTEAHPELGRKGQELSLMKALSPSEQMHSKTSFNARLIVAFQMSFWILCETSV